MNILTKSFGATAKLTIDLGPAGLAIAVSDVEAASTQGAQIVLQPAYVIDKVVALVNSPAWLVSVANVAKAELQSLANQAAAQATAAVPAQPVPAAAPVQGA